MSPGEQVNDLVLFSPSQEWKLSLWPAREELGITETFI